MNKREVFQKVKEHLLTQREAAIGNDDECMYRADSGRLKCAVGCLIPDDLYDPDIEGVGITQLTIKDDEQGELKFAPTSQWQHDDAIHKFAQILNKTGIERSSETRAMLCDLQRLHDSEEPDYWEYCLNSIEAELFGE